MGYNEKVVIIGAGISGLACAHRLKQLHIPSVVLEAGERAGGAIATVRRNGYLFEVGPQCPRFPASVWQLVRELNLETEFVAGDPKANRYILRNGRLHPAPFSLQGMITTGLVGPGTKFRILTEVFRSSSPPPEEESLAKFVQRKFGGEILDNLVDPVVSTVFLGDSFKMGMESAFPALVGWERNHGSLIRGAIRTRKSKRNAVTVDGSVPPAQQNADRSTLRVTDSLPSLGSFTTGMGALPERLAANLLTEIQYRAGVVEVSLLRDENGGTQSSWEIKLANGERLVTENLVLALPAYAAAQLLTSALPQLAGHLEAIEYAPMCVVSLAYERSQVRNTLDGFGFMVPRKEGLQTICTFWNSSLFPGRAPEGKVLLTSFARIEAGGKEYAEAVAPENAKTLGITGDPIDRMVWKDARALPQYNVGHARRVEEIGGILRALPNLHITGNFLKGRSIGDCVESAFGVAEDLHGHLQGKAI